MEMLIKRKRAKENFAVNHGHKMLRRFDNLPIFIFTISEKKLGY